MFEDEHMIIVNKQAGLLSVSTDKMEPDTLHSRVVDYLKSENEKSWAFIVHRLDRETSGVMILVLSSLPPRPTSIIAISTFSFLKNSNAKPTVISKNDN